MTRDHGQRLLPDKGCSIILQTTMSPAQHNWRISYCLSPQMLVAVHNYNMYPNGHDTDVLLPDFGTASSREG